MRDPTTSNCAYGYRYRAFREALLEAYGSRCSGCGSGEESRLEAHHREHKTYPCGEDLCDCGKRKVEWTDLIILCRDCHRLITNRRKSLSANRGSIEKLDWIRERMEECIDRVYRLTEDVENPDGWDTAPYVRRLREEREKLILCMKMELEEMDRLRGVGLLPLPNRCLPA